MTPPEGDRVEHYRGPGRGDGHRRRSIAWHDQRDTALTRPCPYSFTIPSPRAFGGQPRRLRCDAGIGEPCRDPRTGEELDRQPAHSARLRPSLTPAEETSR